MYLSLWPLLLAASKRAGPRDMRVKELSSVPYSLTSGILQDSEPCLGSTLELTVFCFLFVFLLFHLFYFGVGMFRLDSPEGMRVGLGGMSEGESNLRT